jgi:hypothetical protein
VRRLEGTAEPGTKSAIDWGNLVVQAATAGLPAIFAALAGWLARRPDEKVRLKWRDGDREVEIECSHAALGESRIDELVDRLRGVAQLTRSPGAKRH